MDADLLETRSPKRKRAERATDPRKRAQAPGPNYRTLKRIDYQDLNSGMQFRLADPDELPGQRLLQREDPSFRGPEENGPGNYARQLFWVRDPIYLRHGITEWPEPGKRLEMIWHTRSQTMCRGTVEEIFIEGRRKTGYMVLRDFVVVGKPADPRPMLDMLEALKAEGQSRRRRN